MSAMNPGNNNVLSVAGLSVSYRVNGQDHVAVGGATFDIAAGERVAIVGESGSGKTSLCLAVAGFLPASNARVDHDEFRFNGENLNRALVSSVPRRTPMLSMVFQDAMTSLDPVWAVGSQLRAVIRTRHRRAGNKPSRSEVMAESHDWLQKVGLSDSDRVMRLRPYEMSGGMRQRAMLAVALCSRPTLLIADEPTSALDPRLSREVMDLMIQLVADEDAALMIITHDIALCLAYADRILVMHAGGIVDDLRTADAAETAADPYTRGLLACVPTLDQMHDDELPTLDGLASNASYVHRTETVAS
jgi:ABC-type dipeptide/oligopeptide/nickel transport system ATPase component